MARKATEVRSAGVASTGVPSAVQYVEARARSIEIWTPVVWSALTALRTAKESADRDELGHFLAEVQFHALADRALWAVTEISAAWRWKYAAQQYVSRGVLDRWDALALAAKRPTVDELLKDLRHEHVYERRALRDRLRDAESEGMVTTILSGAVSCVVTVEEDARLNRKETGWDRYKRAKEGDLDREVEVIDRLKLSKELAVFGLWS